MPTAVALFAEIAFIEARTSENGIPVHNARGARSTLAFIPRMRHHGRKRRDSQARFPPAGYAGYRNRVHLRLNLRAIWLYAEVDYMRAGFDATKRNRNIGTSKQGHGQNNHLRVASPWSASGPFWAQLSSYRVVHRTCAGRELAFFVEDTREDCVHACTVSDLATVLNHIPARNYASLAAIVLRQPKRKEQVLHPVWGRMGYWADIGRAQDGTASGPVIILEAFNPTRTWSHRKSAGPVAMAELKRLAADGHVLTPEHSRIRIESSLEATRATQLYRTLPHEIGHLVDYAAKVPDIDALTGVSDDRHWELYERYWQIPKEELERSAHRYADEIRSRLTASGVIPFPRIESWDEDGLRSCDFE